MIDVTIPPEICSLRAEPPKWGSYLCPPLYVNSKHLKSALTSGSGGEKLSGSSTVDDNWWPSKHKTAKLQLWQCTAYMDGVLLYNFQWHKKRSRHNSRVRFTWLDFYIILNAYFMLFKSCTESRFSVSSVILGWRAAFCRFYASHFSFSQFLRNLMFPGSKHTLKVKHTTEIKNKSFLKEIPKYARFEKLTLRYALNERCYYLWKVALARAGSSRPFVLKKEHENERLARKSGSFCKTYDQNGMNSPNVPTVWWRSVLITTGHFKRLLSAILWLFSSQNPNVFITDRICVKHVPRAITHTQYVTLIKHCSR